MRPVLTRAEMRAYEDALIDAGVPGLLLMENAGRGAAHWLGLQGKPRLSAAEGRATSQATRGSCVRCADEEALAGFAVVVLAGPGKNGGDGFVVARHLLARGADVRVLLWGAQERLSGDVRVMFEAWRAVGGPTAALDTTALQESLASCHWVVDALLGTGLSRELPDDLAQAAQFVNQSDKPVLALDLPTGLDADTGRVWGQALCAKHTVTFGHLKAGLLTTTGHEFAGRITVSQLGVPARSTALQARAWLLEESDLRARLVAREPSAHKGSAGRVVVVAGSPGMVGAARLVGRAALRGGAGLCTLVGNAATVAALDGDVVELMTHRFDPALESATEALLAKAGCLVVGPGLGASGEAEQLVRLALRVRRPTVLDADGLRLVGGDKDELRAHGQLVLTPHPGEAAALLGVTTAAVEQDRFGAARTLAATTGALVVLKGSRTLVATPSGDVFVSAWGSPALATAGSGDSLAGLLGALVASLGASSAEALLDAALLGVGLHALAGEHWSAQSGDAGLLASEIADHVVAVRARLLAS